MRRLLCLFLLCFAPLLSAHARPFSQADLEALLAPVALYPDSVLRHVLTAATYPDDVQDAAEWQRENPHVRGQEAVRAAETLPWHPSLKALLGYPDLLQRMAESPQWTEDLGDAYLAQQAEVMQTIHTLRWRAQGSTTYPDHYSVAAPAATYVLPPPHIVYVRPYPHVVYVPSWHARPYHKHKHLHGHHGHHRKHHRAHRERHQAHQPSSAWKARIHNHVHQAQEARPIIQGAHLPQSAQHHPLRKVRPQPGAQHFGMAPRR